MRFNPIFLVCTVYRGQHCVMKLRSAPHKEASNDDAAVIDTIMNE
jgi:hypothetical protein